MATLAQDMTQDIPAETRPVDPLDVSRAELYRDDTWQAPFRQLRAEAPVYRCDHSDYGAYWSVSSYKAIVEVESLPDLYSSEAGGITLADFLPDSSDVRMPMFIARDRPVHTGQRRTVAPAFTPSEMARLSSDIRERGPRRCSTAWTVGEDVRLGRYRGDRTDDADAGAAVRLSPGLTGAS